MDEKQLEELRAEGQFAINDPEAYVLSNPTPHDWTMSAQEIARSVKINPLRFGFTTEEIEGPRKLNMVETAIKGSWDNIVQGVNDFDSMMNVRDVEYSSPNMTEAEATRLMQDALYTRHKGRESSQELTAQKIKYNTLYDISNAVGSLIKYVGLGFITGSPAAVGAVAGLESMAGMEADMVDRYIDQTGGIEGYDKKRRDKDLGIAGSYGIFTAITESMLGVDRIAAGALGRYSTIDAASRLARIKGQLTKSGLLQAGRRFGMSAIEEGAEEFIQSVGEDVANYIAGYEDAVFTDENLKKALTSALYGAMLGGPAGWFVYRYNRKSVIDKINKMSQERNWGLTDQQIAEATDQIIEDAKTTIVDEIATRAEIKNHYGQAYELVKQRITEQIDATGTTPWTDQNKSKEEYITVLADSITIPAVNVANTLNIPLSEFLEIADINTATIAGNIAWLQPITSVEDLDKIIAEQDAVIKQEREAKKLGVGDEDMLKRARTRKAIAERVRKQIIGEQAIRTIRQTRKKETADYVKAKDLQPEQVNTLENAIQATADQDYVLFGGIRIPVEYQVVELNTIQPSHIDGTPNPAYSNVELQNRASRGTVEDVADLREKATNITPERLMRASTSAEGAPVVNAKGEVIAGNGREEIIRYAYENPETAEKYKQELAKQGFNIEGMQQPILVRRNTTMTDQEQIAAADISNISETSAFDNASQARRDTQYLKDSKTPIEFASKLPMSERRGLMQNNGKWNKRKIQQRYEDALLAWLCGNDTQLFENLVLDRGLSQKVINILTDNGTLIYETATKYPETELREDIYHALVKMQKATRDNFLETTQQLELDGHDVMPENIIIWNWLFADITTNRQFLQSYATTLASNRETVNAGEDMFGQTMPPLSKKDALMQALKKADQAKAETMAARGREYAPLFDENGMVTDVNLAAAIASYNNQFAPVNTGSQLSPEVLQQFDLADENARLDDIYPEYTGETLEVDGKERTVYNSEGQRIAKSKEALTNFWRWFGDSKVVDSQGRPLVVYHGTKALFDTFEKITIGKASGNAGFYGTGFYFTDKQDEAQIYAETAYVDDVPLSTFSGMTYEQAQELMKKNAVVMPLYLKSENPFMWDNIKTKAEADRISKQIGMPLSWNKTYKEINRFSDDSKSMLFSEKLKELGYDGVIKGIEFVVFEPTQIKSVNNRGTYSADTGNIYYQTGYASMRGELIGEYIDANLFAHSGEGPNVHGWGNYFLASKDIDKRRYFEKFNREGPNVRYNGKEVTRYLLANELKLNNKEIQDLIIYRMQDITMPKQWFVDAAENILNKERYEYERHTKAIELRFRNQLGEARVKEILNDIEKLVMGRGATTDDIAFPFVEGSEEAKIQDKYRDADGKLSEDFMEVWRGLIKEFGGDDTMTAQYPTVYQRTVANIVALRQDLETIKNLDFDKFTGRTGMTYKGENFMDWFVGRLREEENDLNNGYVDVLYMQRTRSMIFDNLKNILKKGGNIIDAVNKFEKENIKPWLDIKPEVKQYIKDTIAKKKDEYPDADAKAVQKFLFEFMDKIVEDKWPSDGMVYQKWYTEEASDADKKLIDAVTGNEDHGIKYPGQQEDNKEIIIGLINKIRDAESNYRVSKLARKILKDTKKSDFVYKPNASMYKTDQIPENDELLDFSKKLNKQPKLVQEGLLRMIEENRQAMPFLNHFLEYQALQSWDVLDALFDVGDKQGMWDWGLMRDIAFNMMNSEPFKKDYAVRDAIADMGSRAIRYTTSQATQEGRPATVKNLISALNEAAESMLPKANGKVAFNGEENDIYQLRDILIKRVSKHGLDTKLEDITDDIRPVEFANIKGDYLFRQIDNYLSLFNDAVRILRNDPIINAPNAGSSELTSKLLLKYGIRGVRYWGSTDKRGFVTFEPTKPTELLYSRDLSKNLVVTHGITLDKLEKALELGGFPVPSIAISKITEPLTNFGTIKLVGTKETINPELRSSNLVYDRDIWSKRFPRPEYKNAKLADVRKFRDKFEKYFVRADNTSVLYGSITDPLVNSRYPAQAIEAFQNSDGAKLYYIENILGDKIDVPKYDRAKRILDNLTLFVKADEQFIKEISEIDVNIDNIDKLRKEIEKPIRDLINRYDFTKEYGKYADKIKQEAENHYFSEKFKGSDITYMIRSAKEYLRMLKDDNIRYGVDSMGLDSVINKYNLYDNQDYMDWSEKQITDLLGEPRVRVGNRLLAWTPENITTAMIKGRTIGTESDSISIGKIIASGAKRFSNLESIREEGKRLQPQKQSEEQTDQLGHDMYMFAEDIIAAAELSDNYSNVDMILLSLQEGVSRNSITEDGLEKLLNKNLDILAKYPRNMLKRGVDLIKQTKEIVRFYFEAKPQRFVSFNEFAGAVVPANSRYDEIASKLAERGLYVARTDNLEEGIRYIESQTPVLFQKRGVIRGSYYPELQAIVLTKYWNETTLVHEYHHRFLEKLWGYFKQAQTGERAVSDEFLADMDKLFQMLEIDPAQDQLTVVQQEKFATMVEAYLTGLGVDNPDNLAFQSFLHWIPEQYKSIMDLGYLDENNEIQNPILDQESIDWFNKWFACPFAPSLASAPDAQRIVNPTDKTGQIVPSSQKIMNNREKEWGQDSEEQNKADAQLWRAINENTPNDMRAALDGEKVNMKAATNNLPDDTKLPEPHKPTLRDKWFKTYQPNARERAANMAREYLALNPEHARELAFADPETMTEFDAPVDQGMLIRAVMETVPHGSDEWYILNDNLATVKSMSGSTLSLSGDLSHQAYLDAKREVEAARELKAAVNYAGTRRGAMDKWNNDIKAFIAQRTEALLATEPDSEERKTAIKAFLEEAKTKFSANTTDAVLNQLDLTGIKTKNRQVFIKWAEKQIKQAAHAKIDANEQKELIKASIAAQLALKEIDSTVQVDGKYTRAVQSAKDIRHWQFVKDKVKKAYIGRWGKFGIFWDNLFGSYAPSAMLMSVNTLFFANVPSTAINTGTIRLAVKTIGKNNVDEAAQKGEIERIKQVFNASGVNLAQMDKPTSPSTLHGEKYTKSEQSKWYDFTFEVLGRTDNEFRIPTFVDALARIATKDAGGDKAKATVLFKEYAKLNNQSDEAKIARKQALAVANMAVFTQDGTLATGLNQIRTVLNTISRVPLGLEPQGFGLGNILAPFLKTGANITEMGFDAMLAPIRTMAMGFQKLQGKEIPDIKKLALTADWINLAWTAVMIALMAAISGDDDEWYTEPYTSGRKYDAEKPYDSIRFGNVWVKMDMFGPISVPLRTAAMLIKDWEDKKLAAIGDGMFEALSETPLVQQFTDSSLDYMSKQPEKYWSSFGYNQANKLVPAQAKSVIKATSRATDAQLDTNWLGKTIDRKFHRNYGLDAERLTTNDLIQLLTNRLKYTEQ